MPDQGRLTEDLVSHTAPVLSPQYPPPPWKLPGARSLKVIFETDKEPVLAWLPPKLTRSSPPYAIITIDSYPESPVGPFNLATQYIGCRAGFFQRAYALQSVVDNAAALSAMREVWGLPCKPGEVTLTEAKDGAHATMSRNGRMLVDIRMTANESIESDLVRYDPVLSLRLVPSIQENVRHDLIQLVQIDPDLAIRESVRGKGVVLYPDSSEDAWDVLPVRNVISAVYCTLDTELPLARFVIPY